MVHAADDRGVALLLLLDAVVLNFTVLEQAVTQMFSSYAGQPLAVRLSQFYQLTKPRIVSLIVFTAVIGMFLATPGMVPPQALLAGTLGIALTAGAAAAFNCLVEQKIDALMARTRMRPLPRGQVTPLQTLIFAGVVGGIGLAVLYQWVNALTMWLTLATFVGYAIVYTVILKPLTPQNIVIGGASGAMPPVLGWTAVTGEIAPEALLLFLIIFAWTPPHFWALALYRKHEYARAGVPMLPVTHGDQFTRLHVLLYTVILTAVTLLPFITRMSGAIYLITAAALDALFLWYAVRIYIAYSDRLAQRTFRYSIVYLTALFAALLADHYFRIAL
jgi:heme o synthase